MAVQISVAGKPEGADWEFQVRLTEGKRETHHRVTVAKSYYEKLSGGKISPEDFVRQAFEFLLAREPKEAILRAFDITVIKRYFPEFEAEMQRRCKAASHSERSEESQGPKRFHG